MKVSVGNDTYNLTKYDKIQIIYTTNIKQGNGQYLLPRWKVICNDKNNNGVTTNFIRATKTNSPNGYSGAASLPPIVNSFMFIEMSSKIHGHERVFVSRDRTDIIQITNISFYFFRFSNLTNDLLKSMGRFRIHMLLSNNIWGIRHNIPKNDRYSDASTNWTLLSLNFTVEKCGINLFYDQIDTAHANMCSGNITFTHSIYKMNFESYFKYLFESIEDYRKIVVENFSFENDSDFFREIVFIERHINRLKLEFNNILLEQHEEYLDYIKNEEDSVIERFLNK